MALPLLCPISHSSLPCHSSRPPGPSLLLVSGPGDHRQALVPVAFLQDLRPFPRQFHELCGRSRAPHCAPFSSSSLLLLGLSVLTETLLSVPSWPLLCSFSTRGCGWIPGTDLNSHRDWASLHRDLAVPMRPLGEQLTLPTVARLVSSCSALGSFHQPHGPEPCRLQGAHSFPEAGVLFPACTTQMSLLSHVPGCPSSGLGCHLLCIPHTLLPHPLVGAPSRGPQTSCSSALDSSLERGLCLESHRPSSPQSTCWICARQVRNRLRSHGVKG